MIRLSQPKLIAYTRSVRGIGIGVKHQQANSFLEKKFKKKTDYSKDETIELALETLQQAMGMDLRSEEVEVIMVSQDAKKVAQLTNEEVDEYLNNIANRD
jgi:20S proteasome subunit alpha 1